MRNNGFTRPRAAVAAAVLTGALALAACGGDDDASDAATTTAEETPSGNVGETPTAESGSESGSEAGSAGPGEPAPDVPAVEVTWPEGWEDITGFITSPVPGGGDVHAYGDPANNFASSVVIVAFPESFVGGQTYEDLLTAQGQDIAEFTELPEREIDGRTVTPYEFDVDTGPVVAQQHLYPVELDDGGLVEITLVAPQESVDELLPVWDEILDSITID